jgi:5-methylcytosine-specific restriction endonuclease McrA
MQTALKLAGGFHVGPLFITQLRRQVVRPKGKCGMIHRAQTKRATPKWLSKYDRNAIACLYQQARALTKMTGELHVVDHIVPKINPLVCGLHVPWNLRVIHWLENAQKGAYWWPDMPNEQIELFN